MEDPVGVLWNHKREICEVLVSAKHLSSIELMFNYQPKMPMLEGFIAHELSHCVELKELDAVGGYSEMRKLLMNPDTRFASELLADIVAIMYWKQFYKNDSVWYIAALLKWRRMTHGDDVLHATFPSLQQALPLIPARVDYQRAVEIRDIVLPR